MWELMQLIQCVEKRQCMARSVKGPVKGVPKGASQCGLSVVFVHMW